MQLETFRGPDPGSVLQRVRLALGRDALVVSSRTVPGTPDTFEVVATTPQALARLERALDGGRAAAKRARNRSRIGPYTLALIGPPGAGKTTTTMKVALHPDALGGRRVGIVTLDTYRVGALDEIQTYAEIARLPLEVVYGPEDVPGALERLRDRDVVVIDTPGRWGGDTEWQAALAAVDPDEVHLVLPAGVRHDVARTLRRRSTGIEITHALFSKVDELDRDAGLATLAEATGLPVRWIADGHDVPGSLAPALPRILRSLGRDPAAPEHDRLVG